jgi:alcohol dehydrogenase
MTSSIPFSQFEPNLYEAKYWQWDNVPRVIVGTGAVEKVGREATRLLASSGKKVLIVTDKGVNKAGLIDKVRPHLEKEGLNITVYDELTTEPSKDSMSACAKYARDGKYDLIVGVGGGAAMDSAKVAAGLLTNPGPLDQYATPLEDRFKFRAAPKILIPTTAGTGSETSWFSVIIEKETMYKTWIASPAMLADVAIVDPLMTLGLPPKQTAGTAFDALGHNGEGYICSEANPISDAQAVMSIELVAQYTRRAYHKPDDLEARLNVAMAAMMGGIVISYPWIGGPAILGHCVAEALGPRFSIPHGNAVGLCLPFIMEYNLPNCIPKLKRFAAAMGENVQGISDRAAAVKAIESVVDLAHDVELPLSLKAWNVPQDFIPQFADYLVKDRQILYNLPRYNPRRLTIENITDFMYKLYDGRILE